MQPLPTCHRNSHTVHIPTRPAPKATAQQQLLHPPPKNQPTRTLTASHLPSCPPLPPSCPLLPPLSPPPPQQAHPSQWWSECESTQTAHTGCLWRGEVAGEGASKDCCLFTHKTPDDTPHPQIHTNFDTHTHSTLYQACPPHTHIYTPFPPPTHKNFDKQVHTTHTHHSPPPPSLSSPAGRWGSQ